MDPCHGSMNINEPWNSNSVMLGQHCVPYHCHLHGALRSHDLKKQKLQGIILPLMFIKIGKTVFSPSDVTLIVDSKNIHSYGPNLWMMSSLMKEMCRIDPSNN